MSALVLREDDDGRCPAVIRNVLVKSGWLLFDETVPADQQPRPNLFWKVNRFFPSQILACVYPYQRVNHYPKSAEITKKDGLHRHMKRMKVVHGQLFSFVPDTFLLPNEYVKFCQYYAEQRDLAQGKSPLYIVKPSDLSRGRKIFVFDDIGELTYDCSSVVQKYIARPLLILGHKVDFRIYVLVTNFQPLRSYIFTDFLTRFGGEEYTTSNKDSFVHLTNYSVTKTAPTATLEKSGVGAVCKWDGEKTKAFFKSAGIDFSLMWTRIETVVACTLLSICHLVPPIPQCFELYGFDILFDDSFQPWLIEANFSPALAVESTVDETVKNALIQDIVATLNIKPFPEMDDEPKAPGAQPAATATAAASSRRPSIPSNIPRARSSSGVTTPSQLTKTPPTSTRSAKARTPSQPPMKGEKKTEVELIDKPAGKFTYVFPFSPTTETISRQMCQPGAQPEACLRQLLAEVKKKDAKAASAMKEFPAIYQQSCEAAVASKSRKN